MPDLLRALMADSQDMEASTGNHSETPGIANTDLAFIVNSFNRRDLLQRALTSVYQHLRPWPAQVLVVDDGSTDGSAELVREMIASGNCPGLTLLQPTTKTPFAAGVNLGILNTLAPYVCLFETDNVVSDSGLWRAVNYLKRNPHVAAVGFRITTLSGEPAGNSMAFPSALGFVLGQQINARLGLDKPPSGPRRDVIFTSPMVLSRAAISKVGLMNAIDFPFCDSDIEWCRRMHEGGYEVHVLEDVSVVHDQGSQRSEFSLHRTVDFHRARLAYFKAYAPKLVPLVKAGLLVRHLGELATLELARLTGKVGRDRVRTRHELLHLWQSDYHERPPKAAAQ